MAAAALAGGSAGLGAVGAIHQAQAEASAANYNSAVANQNAEQAIAQAAEEERRTRVIARKQIGAARAAYGASGVSLEGSPLDVLGEMAATAEMDALTVRHAGRVRAAGYMNEARLDKFRAKTARTGAYFGASGALLGGGAKAASYSGGGGSGGKNA